MSYDNRINFNHGYGQILTLASIVVLFLCARSESISCRCDISSSSKAHCLSILWIPICVSDFCLGAGTSKSYWAVMKVSRKYPSSASGCNERIYIYIYVDIYAHEDAHEDLGPPQKAIPPIWKGGPSTIWIPVWKRDPCTMLSIAQWGRSAGTSRFSGFSPCL